MRAQFHISSQDQHKTLLKLNELKSFNGKK